MNRKEAAQQLLESDLSDMLDAFDSCNDCMCKHFMLGGFLYFAMIISGGVDWCNKANIAVTCFADKEIIDKLRAKVKLYSNDNVIPLTAQKQIMAKIIAVEKQYWLDLQAQSGKWCPRFLIPDLGAYLIDNHYIGNTLAYAYEYSPLNPQGLPFFEAFGGICKEESLAYTFSVQIGQTMQNLYTKIAGSSFVLKKHKDRSVIITDRNLRFDNHTFFKKDNAIFAFNLSCRLNYLLELFLKTCKADSLLAFRMAYVTFYHLKYDLENFGLTSVHYNMPYRNRIFRNAMAHYILFGKISDREIIEDVVGFGLFEKYFGESFGVVNQSIMEELIKTRDSLEKYVRL